MKTHSKKGRWPNCKSVYWADEPDSHVIKGRIVKIEKKGGAVRALCPKCKQWNRVPVMLKT